MSQRVRVLLVLAVTVACLAWALGGIELEKVKAALGSMQLAYVPAALGAITVAFFARVLRFQWLLGEARPSFWRQTVVCGVAFLGINVVPFRLGEFIRSFMLLEDDVSWGTSLSAVVMERIVDLLCLLGMLFLVSAAVDLPAAVVVQGIDVLAAGQRAVFVALLVLVAGLVVLGVARDLVLRVLGMLPVVGERAVTFATSFHAALADLVSKPLRALGVLGLGATIWFCTIASVWLLFGAFPGIPVRWDLALAVTAFTVAGTVAIPTPGFFGPFEAFCKAVLVLYAVEPALAATYAVVWHLHQFGFHVVTGGALLLREGLSLTALVEGSRASR